MAWTPPAARETPWRAAVPERQHSRSRGPAVIFCRVGVRSTDTSRRNAMRSRLAVGLLCATTTTTMTLAMSMPPTTTFAAEGAPQTHRLEATPATVVYGYYWS